jgi:TfoX/Sxy family transcriptional regulator of competence genes
MATTQDYVEYAAAQAADCGLVRYKKMFGDYMVYVNEKPILLVCDNTVFVKILPCLEGLMSGAERGFPYDGAKEHYILDIDDAELTRAVIAALESVTPPPKPRKKKGQSERDIKR